MSGLKDRLSRLKGSMTGVKAGDAAIVVEDSATDETAQAIEDPNADVSAHGHQWMGAEGRMEANEYGPFLIREVKYPLGHQHGHYTLDKLIRRASELTLTDSLEPLRHDRMLFFDTETTGLGIGAGNVPFMIGIGFYTEEHFIVEQLFIRNPAEETAMLVYLQEKLGRYTHLVSYNGRTFDWPIVMNRYVMNRLRFQTNHVRHLDLLYPSRSLWRDTLESCRLGVVEEERLGIERGHDVPGSMAPALYFQYLATGDSSVLEGVFRHNERDIVTLACLSAHFGRLLSGDVPWEQLQPEELYRIGLWFGKAEKQELSAEAFRRLTALPDKQAASYYIPLAEIHKKQGNYDAAVELWLKYIGSSGKSSFHSLEPYVELSMYYEHRCKDYMLALYYAEEAADIASRRQSLSRRDKKQRDQVQALEKRAERIRLKQARAAGKMQIEPDVWQLP
ncbi:ribonuclease H-like domain-containing protein [Paenibacillus gansuensis]|uniref:Ribonuclease H-like domain-containing protein n=1 Tax=Paenibacillus gansuensis TaxID=306542 RepID=A0ABW5PCF3_9BACL